MHSVNQWLASFSVPTSQNELSHCDSLGETVWHHGILWCQVAKNYRNCNSWARWGQLSGRYHNILSLWKFWLQSWEATTCLTCGSNCGCQMCGSSCRGLARKSAGPGHSGDAGSEVWPCPSETLNTSTTREGIFFLNINEKKDFVLRARATRCLLLSRVKWKTQNEKNALIFQ